MILVASALAADIDPLVLPGAGGLGSGNGQVGAGVLYGFPTTAGAPGSLSATLRARVGITDRLALNGGLAAPDTGLVVGLRYNVVQTDTVRLAPWVIGGASADLVTVGTPLADGVGGGVGVALDVGRSVHFDLSVPFVVTGVDPLSNPAYAPLTLGTLGVTVPVGRHDVFRVAIETFGSPAVSWRHTEKWWYIQGTAMFSVLRKDLLVAGEFGILF